MDTIILAGLVLGLVQVLKMSVNINSRYIPISAIVISLAILIGYSLIEKIPISWSVIENGLIVALGSVGLWSGVKNTIK